MDASKTTVSSAELDAWLQKMPEWAIQEGALVRFWSFADFVEAMAFVNRVAALAEAAQHHPDIDIRYNRVKTALVSHDADGITARDTRLAEQIAALDSSS